MNGKVIHALTSHPTPPVFDGPEDRNGPRNFDEIRFWADYVTPGAGGYIYDDSGMYGGLADGASFVIMGDQNSDPFDGDSIPGAAQQILDLPNVNHTFTPTSLGGPEAAVLQDADNDTHVSNPLFDTADFGEPPGNLRADYVLASADLQLQNSGVFWPDTADPLSSLVVPANSSDHRLVFIDINCEREVFGKTAVYLEGTSSAVRMEETNLGNLVADANLEVAQRLDETVMASITFGGAIGTSIGVVDDGQELPPQANPMTDKKDMEISDLDIATALPHDNQLTLITVTAVELRAIIEYSVAKAGSGHRPEQFPQVGGLSFSFDPRQQGIKFDKDWHVVQKGKRVHSLALLDDHGGIKDVIVEKGKIVGDRNREIRIVVPAFLADGGAGYPFGHMGTDREDLQHGGEVVTEQLALSEYLMALHDIGPYSQAETPATEDTRIQNLSQRGDTVLNPEQNIYLTTIGTFATGIFDEGAAEIVAHDPATQRLFFSNADANSIGVLDISDPTNPVEVFTIDLSPYGDGVNSVAVRPGENGMAGLIAVAVEAEEGAENGMVAFFDTDGNFINSVEVGTLPDMLTFSPDGNDVLVANEGEPADPFDDPMMRGLNGFDVTPIFTVGESINGTSGALNKTSIDAYTPVGLLDGLGAYKLNPETVRVFANHELSSGGETYKLANSTSLTGARISHFDIGIESREIVDAGLAYDTIINAAGVEVTEANKGSLGNGSGGVSRFCSGSLVEGGTFSFEDTIYFAGEEDSGANGGLGGLEYALDTLHGVLYALPALGYAAWENVTPIDTLDDGTVGLLIGDDRAPAPLYLYVGNKGLDAAGNPSQDFLARNGLANGTLYHWKADNGDTDPDDFNGTGNGRTYAFIGLERIGGVMVYDVTMPSMPFFVQYINNRDFNEDPENGNPGDLGVEDLKFIAPEDSPNGKALLVSSNEVSGTVTIFQLDDPTIEFQTDRHNRILLLQREGDNVQLINQLTGEILIDQPLEATHSVEITGLERFKDKLTIDFDHGGSFNLPGGVKFDGISGADRLFMFATEQTDMIDVSGHHLRANQLGVKYSDSVIELRIRSYGGDDLIGVTNESILGIPGDPLAAHYVSIVDTTGDETYVLNQSHATVKIFDTQGIDTLDFAKAEQAIEINLERFLNTIGATDIHLISFGTQFENVIGSRFGDEIYGNSADNILRGGAGNDMIKGKLGDDVLLGDEGDDTLAGSRGNDILIGGLGTDHVRGARDSDLLIGGSTVYDRNDAALRAILGQWERTDISYLARIDIVRNGIGIPPVTNFDNLVFDDLEDDTLDGQTTLDWYFEGLGDDLIPDPIPQLANDEVIEMLP